MTKGARQTIFAGPVRIDIIRLKGGSNVRLRITAPDYFEIVESDVLLPPEPERVGPPALRMGRLDATPLERTHPDYGQQPRP